MKWKYSLSLLLVTVIQLLTSCGPTPDAPLPVSPFNPVPYFTPTAVYNPTPTLPPTETPAPTPTPMIYSIATGDTLSKIAKSFGISLELLLAANPGIQPSQLFVGQTIIIPSVSENPISNPLTTPVLADLGLVSCYPLVGGLTCLASIHNPNAEALENIKMEITIFGADGQPIERKEAALPLNILQPDQTLPASAFFPGISSANYVLPQLLASTLVSAGDQRYIEADTEDLLISIDWNGNSSQVTGRVGMREGEKPATLIWLVAVAYDSNGQIVGFRRWDWKGSMQPGEFQPFELRVYSEGPAIDHIDLQVEARP